MSEFFAQTGSDIEEELKEVQDSSNAGGDSGYLPGASEDEDLGKRVVQPANDERLEEVVNTAEQMKNAMKISDWVSVKENYDKLWKQMGKIIITKDVEGSILYKKTLKTVTDLLKQTMEESTKS